MTIQHEPGRRKIYVSKQLWLDTWLGLRYRGGGKLESAAIWAGKRSSITETVEAVYYIDDIEGGQQFRAFHYVPPQVLAIFFSHLQQDRRVIIADIHTHPSAWVGQSPTDEAHPIEFRRGLPALILPSYAKTPPSLSSTGVHLYQGDGKWATLSQASKRSLFVIE